MTTQPKSTEDPAQLRATVRELSPRARSALRILIRSPRPVLAADLEMVAKAIVPDEGATATPASQLVSRSLATLSKDYVGYGREVRDRLSPIDSLRQRLAVLLQDEPLPAPPLPPADEDEFEARLAEFQLGVLVACVDQVRPRLTQTWSLHRVDSRPRVDHSPP